MSFYFLQEGENRGLVCSPHTYIIIIKYRAVVKGFLSYIYVMCANFNKKLTFFEIKLDFFAI